MTRDQRGSWAHLGDHVYPDAPSPPIFRRTRMARVNRTLDAQPSRMNETYGALSAPLYSHPLEIPRGSVKAHSPLCARSHRQAFQTPSPISQRTEIALASKDLGDIGY